MKWICFTTVNISAGLLEIGNSVSRAGVFGLFGVGFFSVLCNLMQAQYCLQMDNEFSKFISNILFYRCVTVEKFNYAINYVLNNITNQSLYAPLLQ